MRLPLISAFLEGAIDMLFSTLTGTTVNGVSWPSQDSDIIYMVYVLYFKTL